MYNNKITKLVFQYICLSVILIDSVFRTGKYYYPQVYLEDCKFVINKKKNIHIYIIDDVEIFSGSVEETLLEKIQMAKKSDYEENSDEKVLTKFQTKKNSDGENFNEEN